MLGIKIQKDAALSSGYLSINNPQAKQIGQEYAKAAENCYKSYGKYKFPSLFENVSIDKSDKLETKKNLSKEDIAELRSLHDKMVAQHNKLKK